MKCQHNNCTQEAVWVPLVRVADKDPKMKGVSFAIPSMMACEQHRLKVTLETLLDHGVWKMVRRQCNGRMEPNARTLDFDLVPIERYQSE